MAVEPDLLDRILDPIWRAMNQAAAKQLLSLRADAETQARVDELADRCNEGLLTPQERSEYESLVAAANVIAVLQAKLRAGLPPPSAA
jgi:hypothetical protein